MKSAGTHYSGAYYSNACVRATDMDVFVCIFVCVFCVFAVFCVSKKYISYPIITRPNPHEH